MNARMDEANWIRCGRCGHKLGRAIGVWSSRKALPAMEIKCKSCKELNYVMIGAAKDE